MTREDRGSIPWYERYSITHLLIVGIGGMAIGYYARPTAGTALVDMANAMIRHASLSTSGPIIAAGLLGTSVIIAAVLVPVSVAYVLLKEGKK